MKKKPNSPNFSPESQPRMSEDEKDMFFAHIIRRPQIFEEGLARMSPGTLKGEDDKYLVLMRGCRELAKKSKVRPGKEKFKGLLKDAVKKVGQEQSFDELVVEAAADVISEGGLIDWAYDRPKGELSDELGRTLLKRFLYEVEVVNPIWTLLSECRSDDQNPKDLTGVLETLLERQRKLESIDAKAVKTFEEEWDEHEQRLKQYRGKDMIGLKTGQPGLDKRTRGLRGLIILGAKPGAGKTTYGAVELAIGVCRYHKDNDCVVIVICLDMDRFELYRRIHCNLGDIEWVPLMFGSPEKDREPGSMFSKKHLNCLDRASERLKGWQVGKRLSVPDRTVLGDDITAHRLTSIIDEKKAQAGAKRAMLIIDYLQLLPVPEEVLARGDLAADKYRIRLVQQVIESSRTKDDPLGDTALVISEARKPPTSKEQDHWGDSMSELMGSARLGYAADAVLLYREMGDKEMEQYYGVKTKEGAAKKRESLHKQGITPVILILEKGRDGMIRGKWGAEFHFNKSVFRELTPDQHLLPSAPPPADTPPGNGAPGSNNGATPSGSLPLPPAGMKPSKKNSKKSK